jgi:hypothetical protein
MRHAAFAGALVLSFVLGGITTLLGFPRYIPAATAPANATISPHELTRSVGPLPEMVVDGYN